MRVAIISDSHGRNILRAVEKLKDKKVGSIIFLGDCYEDGKKLEMITSLPTVNILGNNDPGMRGKVIDEYETRINGYKIFACHGHRFGVSRGIGGLQKKAEEVGADIVLFGHTHRYQHDIVNGIHYFNPGSISIPRGTPYERSFGIMDLADGISFERISLERENRD